MGRSGIVVAQREPPGYPRRKGYVTDVKHDRLAYLNFSLLNRDLIEPDDVPVIVADRHSVVLVRLEVTMRDARVVGRVGFVDVLRRSNPRAQHPDRGQEVSDGTAQAEHPAIMFGKARVVKRCLPSPRSKEPATGKSCS